MQYKFFTIPYHNPEESVAELNRFLVGHRILTVDRQFIPDGSWANDAANARAAHRNQNDPSNRNDNLGFRCVRAPRRVG